MIFGIYGEKEMLKKAIKSYLDKYFKVWEEERDSLPIVCYEEEERFSDLYVGKEEEDECIQWKYKQIRTQIDLSKLEKKYAVSIPQEIKEYYSAYRFLTFGGIFENEYVEFHSIGKRNVVISDMDDWLATVSRDFIRIGAGRWSEFLCVKISDGKVVLWDKEREIFLADSLEELFTKLTVYVEAVKIV